MTNSQKLKVECVRNEVQNIAKNYYIHGEIKEFEIIESEYGHVEVRFQVGDVNDENNAYALIYNREHGQIFIGKRGAITYYKNGKCKTLGKFQCLHDVCHTLMH